MRICSNRIPLAGMDIDKTNTGEKCEQFGDVGVVDSFSPIKIYSVFLNFSFQGNNGSTKLITINRIKMQ